MLGLPLRAGARSPAAEQRIDLLHEPAEDPAARRFVLHLHGGSQLESICCGRCIRIQTFKCFSFPMLKLSHK